MSDEKFEATQVRGELETLAREVLTSTKTGGFTSESVLRRLAGEHKKGASLVELSTVLLAFQYGEGSVSALVTDARRLKGEPEIETYLAVLKSSMLGDAPNRERMLYESYARVFALANAIGGETAERVRKLVGGEVDTRRDIFEKKFGRKLTAEERSIEGPMMEGSAKS